jgi:ketosteroid isomerase-like protein
MLAIDAAERWRQTWEQGWPRGDVDAIAGLYAPDATYRALAFREPDRGIDGVRRYLRENFDAESQVKCRFGEPITMGARAAIQWWASWTEAGERVSMAGVTLLRFQEDGQVIDHRDYWNQDDDLVEPYEGW